MSDGSVYAGLTHQQQIYRFPTWVFGEHQGSVRIFIQSLNNIGYIATNIHPLQNRHTNFGRMKAYIRLEGNNFLRTNLGLMGNEQPPPNVRAQIYVGLPDGRIVNGYFE